MHFHDEDDTRRITITANSPKEMGDQLLKSLPDFTYRSYVQSGNLSLVKFKEKNWKPIQDLLNYRRIKETRNIHTGEIKWRRTLNQHAAKKWHYTGRQTLIVEVNLSKMREYLSALEEHAKSLANDYENTRLFLSKVKNNPDPAIATTYSSTQDFWSKYGYKPSVSPSLPRYVDEQYRWQVEHRALSAEQILRQVLASPKINNKRVLNEIDHQLQSGTQANSFEKIRLKQNNHDVLLGDIIPADELQRLDSLNEHLGANKVYTRVMNYHRESLTTSNPFTEYLQIPFDTINKSKFDDTWGVRGNRKAIGVDKHGNKFRHTFAPDIVVQNLKSGYIEGVLDLKGKTHNQTYLSSTGISFQITELMKYTGEHEVPTAMVVIRQSDDTIFYDWLVIPNQMTPFIKELLDPDGTTNPIIPRTARSISFTKELHNKIIKQGGDFNFRKYFSEFQDTINQNQEAFENLQFYKHKNVSLNGEKFWKGLTDRFYSDQKEEIHNIDFRKFHLKWKNIVNEQFKEELQNLNAGL
ncbi:MAG: hypothetical protein ACTSPV_18070 [Candidatus Hodarchaeales archaeon]